MYVFVENRGYRVVVWDFQPQAQTTKARFPLPELTARVDGPSTRLVETGLKRVVFGATHPNYTEKH